MSARATPYKVVLYVEGGSDTAKQQIECRRGFRKVLESAGLKGSMPRVVAGGSRNATFKKFKTSLSQASSRSTYPILLVDSEDPIQPPLDPLPDSPKAWEHLKHRDGWPRPEDSANDQAQLMVTSMETWIMADPEALATFFGRCLQNKSLLPADNLESRSRQEVFKALQTATRSCSSKHYGKGSISFALLATASPVKLGTRLRHFERFISTLRRHLRS